MDVSIIICSRNRAASLLRVIEAIYRQEGCDHSNWELLVIDNASDDNTRYSIEQWISTGHPNTRYLYEPAAGKALALNRGVTNSNGDILVFTDDDVELTPRWLAEMLTPFALPTCVGVGGRLLPRFIPAPPEWYRPDCPFPYRFDFGANAISLTAPPFGVNMAYRRSAFDTYGLFRADLGPTADNPAGKGEDSEFGRRLLDAGETITYAPDALLYHPLDAHAITKGFMHDWYYQYGRSEVLRSSGKYQGQRYFGVPRYLFRSFARNLVMRYIAADRRQRYQYEMEVYRIRGIIAGHRARRRGGSDSVTETAASRRNQAVSE